jgi:hypothetical protein
MSAATTANAQKVPVAAGATATANGAIAYDSTNNNLHAAQGGVDAKVATYTAAPGNGNCANWSVSGGTIKLGDAGAACGSGGSGGGGVVTYSGPTLTILSGTAFCPVGGGGSCSATETNVDIDSSTAATVSNMYVQLSTPLGAGNSVVVTWRDNAASKSVTCTISGASATSCNDTAHSFNVANGDLLDYQLVYTGTIVVTPTITIMSAFGTSGVGVTSVTGTSPITSTGGTTPAVACATCTTGTPTNHGVVIGAGTQALGATAAGTAGQVLTSNGASADPTFQPAAGGGTSVTPVAFASIPACTTTAAFYLVTQSIFSNAYCNGSSVLSFYTNGNPVTPPSGFAWQNQSTATLSTTNGGELIISAVGNGSNANVNGRFVAYPTPPFSRTLTARIKGFTTSGHIAINGAGGIYISDGTKIIIFGVTGSAGFSSAWQCLVVQFGPSPTNITTNVSATNQYILPSDVYYLKFDDGVTLAGNRTYSYSYDNVAFFKFYQEPNTTNLTATQIGYYAYAFDTAAFTETWVGGWQ